MTTFVAFLRAVNVGGTGKLPMNDLREMCEEIGLANAQTYIASGNLVFTSGKSAKSVKTALESRLRKYANKDIPVVVRTATEIRKVLDDNPFPEKNPSHTVAIFFDEKPARDLLERVSGQSDEEIRLGEREIYVYYGSGMGRSKLKFPIQKAGTARNINTIRKMVELSG